MPLDEEQELDGQQEDDVGFRRRRRNLLHQYYGLGHGEQGASVNPTDINGMHFDVDVYMGKLLREKRMTELLKLQSTFNDEIKQLDNDMQHLVYENHSKFITASDTIKNMKSDFQSMEDRMRALADKMSDITDSSDSINSALSKRKQQIAKLSGVHNLLKKLQFLFELPKRLKKCIDMKAYGQAVHYYTKASHLLEQYQHIQSFEGIRQDCEKIMKDLSRILQSRLDESEHRLTAEDVEETVELLLDLQEPYEHLCRCFLGNFQKKLKRELAMATKVEGDILRVVNITTSGYLSSMQGLVAAFEKLFILKQQDQRKSGQEAEVAKRRVHAAREQLATFVTDSLKEYISVMEEHLAREVKSLNSQVLVHALDKVFCKLHAIETMVPGTNLAHDIRLLAKSVTKSHTEYHLTHLKKSFSDSLSVVEQVLSAAQRPGQIELEVHSSNLLSVVKNGVEESLYQLQAFIEPSVDFCNRPQFREEFCIGYVRIGVVMHFIGHLLEKAAHFVDPPGKSPPHVVLVLSKFCHTLGTNSIEYLMSLADEKFPPSELGPLQHTPTSGLVEQALEAGKNLLQCYVSVEGQMLSQMIRKSIETRDWLASHEPRHVRGAVRRVVEEISIIDKHVGRLFEEGQKKEISDSSRPTYTYGVGRPRAHPYSYSGSGDTPYLSTNIQKLFSERIRVFGVVEFTKLSVVTGVVKIALKSQLECVRLRTFGKFGLQQMQVDCHYLQMYLWTFVSDERIVREFVDEIVSSTVHRCIDVSLMDSSVVDVICEQN